MKFVSIATLACAFQMAAAFAPQPFGVQKPASQLNMHLDPDSVHHIAQHGADAVRVLLLECDNTECAMVEGLKESDGWHYDNRLAGTPVTSEVIMMEMEGTE